MRLFNAFIWVFFNCYKSHFNINLKSAVSHPALNCRNTLEVFNCVFAFIYRQHTASALVRRIRVYTRFFTVLRVPGVPISTITET